MIFALINKGQHENSSLSTKEIFEILQDIFDSSINAVRFTGGEPFLREDLNDILKQAKNLGLYVILNTNGFLINKENKTFFEYVDLVLFSLHYTNRFNKVTDSMNIITEFNTKIMLATTATENNILNLETFYKFCFKYKTSEFCRVVFIKASSKRIQ